jgi:hypothetical protein
MATRLRQRLSLAGEFSPLSEPLSLHQRNDEKREKQQETNSGQPGERPCQHHETERGRNDRNEQKNQRIITGSHKQACFFDLNDTAHGHAG